MIRTNEGAPSLYTCSENANPTNVKGIIYYSDSLSTPSTTGYSYTDSCVDEDMSDLTPIVSETVSSPFYNKSEPVSLGKTGGSLYRWKLNSTSMHVDWTTNPTPLEVCRGHHSWTNASSVVGVPQECVDLCCHRKRRCRSRIHFIPMARFMCRSGSGRIPGT